MGYNLYVLGLPYDYQEQQLEKWFKEFGQVLKFQCYRSPYDRTKTVQVKFMNQHCQSRAYTQFKKKKIKGIRIFDRQICWACEQKNPMKPHLKSCLNSTKLSDFSITSEKLQDSFSSKLNLSNHVLSPQKKKQSLVSQTINVVINPTRIEKLQNRYPIKLIMKDNVEIIALTDRKINLEEVEWIEDSQKRICKLIAEIKESGVNLGKYKRKKSQKTNLENKEILEGKKKQDTFLKYNRKNQTKTTTCSETLKEQVDQKDFRERSEAVDNLADSLKKKEKKKKEELKKEVKKKQIVEEYKELPFLCDRSCIKEAQSEPFLDFEDDSSSNNSLDDSFIMEICQKNKRFPASQ